MHDTSKGTLHRVLHTHVASLCCTSGAGVLVGAGGAGGIGEVSYTFGLNVIREQRMRRTCSRVNSLMHSPSA